MGTNDEPINIYPRCLDEEHKDSHSLFLSPDGFIRPCCYVNNTRDWDEFLVWMSANDLDTKDLVFYPKGVEGVMKTDTMQTLKSQLLNRSSSCPSICKSMCGKPTTKNLHPIKT